MEHIINFIVWYFGNLSIIIRYLKLYLVFFIYAILYRPKAFATVLFFLVLYFYLKNKKLYEDFTIRGDRSSLYAKTILFFNLHTVIDNGNSFLVNQKKRFFSFTYPFVNFFLLVFIFIYFFFIVFLFFLLFFLRCCSL